MKSLAYYIYRLKYKYPHFFGHKPVHLDLEIAGACNMVCPFCYRQDKDYKGPKAEFMNYIDACIIMQDAYDAGMRSIKFNWRGEPTLHKDLKMLAYKAKKIGFLDRMINTNGSKLLDVETLENLTEIRFSLDTMIADEYEKMRPPFKLKDIVINIGTMIHFHKPKKTKIIIQRRTTDKTESDDKFMHELCKRTDSVNETFKHVKLISKPVQPRVGSAELYGNRLYLSYYDMWKKGDIKRQYCKQVSQRLVVGVDGEVQMCCLNYNNSIALNLGNINDYLISQFIKCGRRTNTITDLKKEKFYCQECERCTSYTAYKGK